MKELYDKDMREALFSYFEDNFGKLRFLEEFPMGKSRADAVMVSDRGLTGFEIKSDKDSLVRLSRQVKDYDKYYDFNYLVVGYHFEEKAANVIPDNWGIIKIYENENKLKVEVVREAVLNESKVLTNQLSFLWRNELVKIMREYKLGAVSGINKKKLSKTIYSKLDENVVRNEIINTLMEREYPKIYYFYYTPPKDEKTSEDIENIIGNIIGNITIVTDGEAIEYISLKKVNANYIYTEDISLHRNIKKQFDEYFLGKRKDFELPLKKIRCNSFSRKIYEAIKQIPYGDKTTCVDIATKAGNSEGFRTVGAVCNKNIYPIIIPCHRIVGKNGAITKYIGGREMKMYLLNLENKYKNNSCK